MGMVYGYLSPRSRNKTKKQTSFKPYMPPAPMAHRNGADDYKAAPSAGTAVGNATVSLGVRYEDPEMAKREAVAREVKHPVAPLCNKGAYQVIPESDYKTMGRKV